VNSNFSTRLSLPGNLARRFAFCLLSLALLPPQAALADGATNALALPAVPPAIPDMGGSVLRVFGALILVVAIFLGGVWLFRNWQRFAVRKSGAPKLSVIEVKSLGQRQAIYVVGYQQQRMLLASSPAGITLVSHLPEADGAEAAAPAPAVGVSFVDAFQQVLSRKSS
jgi:flagellar biogenesis protein FliO